MSIEHETDRLFPDVIAHRLASREGRYSGPTGGLIPENVLCNLVVLPRIDAYDFLVYCMRNPKPCPVIEVFDPGDPISKLAAPGADMRTDLSRYAISRDGVDMGTCTDITDLWSTDSVALLMGSSLTFDHALERAGVLAISGVWVLKTSIKTVKSGKFEGPLIVTMRWMKPEHAIIATQLTARFAWNHGAPVHIGDPRDIGADLANPIWGESVAEIPKGVVPVFWACGVTPQFTAKAAKPSLMITHAPAHGFVTDLMADQYCLP